MKVIHLLLPMLTISVNAFALPKETNADQSVTKQALANVDECVNFSGIWKGSCKSEGTNRSGETTEIKQFGCATVVVDDESFDFDGTRTDIREHTNITSTTVYKAEWDNEKKSMTIRFDLMTRDSRNGVSSSVMNVS